MSWADHAIEKLSKGEEVQIRPKGGSMKGKVESGQLVTLRPAAWYQPGDIVLAKVKGRVYLHLVKAVAGDKFLIGNNKGHDNGWTSQVYGKAVRIEP